MNYLAAGLITSAIIIAVHMTARVFHAPEGNVIWRIVRYVGGCAAILAGALNVIDWPTWLILAGVVVVAGATTVLCYAAVELYNWRNRAIVAEADHDSNT